MRHGLRIILQSFTTNLRAQSATRNTSWQHRAHKTLTGLKGPVGASKTTNIVNVPCLVTWNYEYHFLWFCVAQGKEGRGKAVIHS